MSYDNGPGPGRPSGHETSSGPLDTVSESASAAIDSARSEAGDLIGTSKEHVADLTDQAMAQARDLLGEARAELRSRAGEESAKVADALKAAATQLQSMADGADDPHHPIVEATRQAAQRTSNAADRLSHGGVDGLLSDVKRFARQRPVVFLGGVLGLGIVAGRVFRNADRSGLADAVKPDAAPADGDVGADDLFGRPGDGSAPSPGTDVHHRDDSGAASGLPLDPVATPVGGQSPAGASGLVN